ncbi:hypothetical protein [Nocardia tengchongensis]|uniref:hypothetical protein n=1 Tax=Nocardia tengchongensis TaxID=2055889 RepID=UPI003615E934
MARKGAFRDNDLDDIDDLLPPVPPAETVVAPPPVPSIELSDPPHGSPHRPNPAPKPRKAAPRATAGPPEATKRPRATQTRAKTGQGTAEAHVASVVAEALRKRTHGEKERRGKGRSYGEVVLDAIETFEQDIQQHFAAQANPKPTGRLFKRVDHSRPRRRRHEEPPVKIPLAGIIPADIEMLDSLAVEWQAGSRSALVDYALKLYLSDDIARLEGQSDPDDEAGTDI